MHGVGVSLMHLDWILYSLSPDSWDPGSCTWCHLLPLCNGARGCWVLHHDVWDSSFKGNLWKLYLLPWLCSFVLEGYGATKFPAGARKERWPFSSEGGLPPRGLRLERILLNLSLTGGQAIVHQSVQAAATSHSPLIMFVRIFMI